MSHRSVGHVCQLKPARQAGTPNKVGFSVASGQEYGGINRTAIPVGAGLVRHITELYGRDSDEGLVLVARDGPQGAFRLQLWEAPSITVQIQNVGTFTLRWTIPPGHYEVANVNAFTLLDAVVTSPFTFVRCNVLAASQEAA